MTELYITGLCFTLLGLVNLYKPSNKIGVWGYRSERSIESNANWKVAQHVSGKGLITTGLFLMCLSFLFSTLFFSIAAQSTLAISACIFAVLDTIFQTELALLKESKRI